MKKVLDKMIRCPVSLYIHTYIHTYIRENIIQKGGSTTRTSFLHGKRGDWYLVSSHLGDIYD